MIQPSPTEFLAKAREGNLVPVVREVLADHDTPVSAYERLRAAGFSHTFLLESVEGGETLARYSFLGGNPRTVITGHERRVEIHDLRDGAEPIIHEDVEPLAVVEDWMKRFRPVPVEGLPPFIGGAVGFLGYDSVAQFDKVPANPVAGLDFPDLMYVIADSLVVFDRARHSIILVANAYIPDGADEAAITDAYQDALDRIAAIEAALNHPLPRHLVDTQSGVPELEPESNFDEPTFHDAVENAKEYIRAGDIIQVVLSQRFQVPWTGDPLDVYRALRTINPSPYMFCLEFGEHHIIGSSPEVHVGCEHGQVRIRPIAGTRKRKADPAADQAMEDELLADPKERAEHVMLVDLARNDIGRVCRPGSVAVKDLMIIERYSHVMHIVSEVTGQLTADHNAYDLMRATFPAGTVSGAPKVRAMQLIAEFEPDRRGPYAGAIGYFGFDGNHDSCITIRTVIMDEHHATVQAGAGIVADSIPELEYKETQNKARGMLRALAVASHYTHSRSQT